MTYGSHIRRTRHGTLCFRYVVPQDLRPLVGQSEVTVGLGAMGRREAHLIRLELQLAVDGYVATVRQKIRMSEALPSRLALRALLNERKAKILQQELEASDSEV